MTPRARVAATFGAGLLNEVIQVLWVHHAEAGHALRAAAVTLVMCTVSLLGLSSIVDAVSRKNWRAFAVVAAAWATGSALGTAAGVAVAKGSL